ncbi:hypothetical protein ACFX2J_016543 [Malus domestica]
MPIAASVQGLGVHLRTAKATKSAALSQLADKETNMRTTKSRHELGKLNRVLFLCFWVVLGCVVCGRFASALDFFFLVFCIWVLWLGIFLCLVRAKNRSLSNFM